MVKEKETTAEATAKGRTLGEVRCMNCMKRIRPPSGAKMIKCPQCDFEWRISWLWPDFPRVRGPVWDVNRRLTEEILSKESKKEMEGS